MNLFAIFISLADRRSVRGLVQAIGDAIAGPLTPEPRTDADEDSNRWVFRGPALESAATRVTDRISELNEAA